MHTGKWTRLAGLLLLTMMVLPVAEVQAGGDFVLRAGHLHTGQQSIVDGAIVVRDGRVVESGPWAQISSALTGDLPLLHWPDEIGRAHD